MKVVLISGHAADSDRKTGFHFWAEILAKRNIDVDFLTVGSSPISLLKKGNKQLKRPYNQWVELSPHIRKFTWMPIFHPFNFSNKILNFLTWPLFAIYPSLLPKSIKQEISDAHLFVVENGAGLMLVPKIAKLNPKAKFIYNFSDSFNVVKFHPIIPHSQKSAMPNFSMIRVNASALKRDLPANAPTQYIPQAIDKSQFDQDYPNPYKQPRNAISVGDMLFDSKTVEDLAKNFPGWTFHVFGAGAKVEVKHPNIIEYGEVPHSEIIPYLKHADVALAPYNNKAGAEYLSESSLKMVQYTYCQLPIIAPDFAAKGRDHVISYDTDTARTPVLAFDKAMHYDKARIDRSQVMGWEDVVDKMLKVVN